ncbi:MAG: AAA family ATPase [Acidimicrobiia bacterium]|nr:AAA family ATPase [Acidimicrobiia bacterium]
MIRILLASSSATFEHRVRNAYEGSLNGDMRRATEDQLENGAHLEFAKRVPDSTAVLAIGPDVPVKIALEMAASFDQHRPEVSVVMVAPVEPDLFQQAMRSGVRDVIAPEATDSELRDAIDRALEGSDRRRGAPVAPPEPEGPIGKIITVVSPKGGSGKTTIATNLAVSLAKAQPGKVVLVDLDLQFGDITFTLGLQPEKSIHDATSMAGTLDLTTLKLFLTPRRDGLFVLCAPGSPAEGEEVSAELAAEAIRLLATEFPLVVIDTSAGLTEHTLAAIDQSTDVVMACDLSRTSVLSTRKVIDALDALQITEPNRKLVLNRAGSRVGVEEQEVVSTIGMRVDIGIPSSRAVPVSMNEGVPIVESNAKSDVARKIMELASQFADVTAAAPTGLLGRLAG